MHLRNTGTNPRDWEISGTANRGRPCITLIKPVAIYAPAQNVTFGQTLGKIFLA